MTNNFDRALMGDPRCDDCGGPVEKDRVKWTRGLPQGPFQCALCAAKTAAHVHAVAIARRHEIAAQNNYFDSICQEVDPKLAEAIHRVS
jgi:hypothetical protein